MFMRSILLGAAAVGASAMLVVPELEALENPPAPESAVDSIDIDKDSLEIHPMLLQDNIHSVVELPCTECPFREVGNEGAVNWKDNTPSSLMLDFSIDEGRLLANGRQIFPPIPPAPIQAVQQLESGEESDAMPVGFALEVMPVATADDAPGVELVEVRFTVLDLETNPVPVDTVAITILQDNAGNLYIMNTEIEKTTPPTDTLSWKKCAGKAKCLQELVFTRISGLLSGARERMMKVAKAGRRKGCHGKHKGHAGPMRGHHGPKHHGAAELDGFFPLHELDAPKGHHPHPPHHHRPHPPHGAFAHTFSRVLRFIAVPAILGVLAGLTASAVGMIVGQVVIFIWRRYRGTTPQAHKAAWEDGNACEKQGLMGESSEDVLPEYTEETSPRGSMDKN
ncbi:hypothetical protein N7492_000241 [Penicillium capsulatum]|uniref:DUF7728 domain-containing protein n=1 Tax=Penicillium capsulatum TaxID=69766 RepID=A0A9W9IT57_9EURO|nr:hypothetical protein N7492_000241 [Penicillium capsulatum]KAJ6130693.1 hypothetical protein N7512_003473 [Penicillium capsulatum]